MENVSGRKSDLSDAEWLADVAAQGMVRPSIVSPPGTRKSCTGCSDVPGPAWKRAKRYATPLGRPWPGSGASCQRWAVQHGDRARGQPASGDRRVRRDAGRHSFDGAHAGDDCARWRHRDAPTTPDRAC
jgi:hypothetical protein